MPSVRCATRATSSSRSAFAALAGCMRWCLFDLHVQNDSYIDSEVGEVFVLGELFLEEWIDFECMRVLVVFEERPELLHAIQLIAFDVVDSVGHEVSVDFWAEARL